MVIQLVGAGLPRTGTSSLREALRHLLGAPVHHMSEVFAHPEQAATWARAIEGEPPVWDEFLAEYAAGVDAPFSNCWRELAAAYPEAPVLLSHRGDPEVWLRSMEATVLPRTREMLAGDDTDPVVPLFRVLFRDVVTDLGDRDALVAAYERRLREVRAEVPADRLVEWQPEDGWGPLGAALDLPVPDRPFPHENSTADHVARHASRACRDRERRTPAVRAAGPPGSAEPVVRAVRPGDWREWRALRRAALAQAPEAFGSTLEDWSGPGDVEERWRARLSGVDLNLVVAVDDRDVAIISGDRVAAQGGESAGDHVVEVLSLWVDPAARGLGVGHRALESVLAWAQGTCPGLDVVLSVRQGNRSAVRLYERHGFVDEGVSPDADDERRMVRRWTARDDQQRRGRA